MKFSLKIKDSTFNSHIALKNIGFWDALLEMLGNYRKYSKILKI